MASHFRFAKKAVAATSLLLLAVSPLFAAEEERALQAPKTVAKEPLEAEPDTEPLEVAEEVPTPVEYEVETQTLAKGFAGYRFFTVDGLGVRAAEYEFLHSRATGGGTYSRLGKDLKLAVEGSFLNEKDYHGDFLFDCRGNHRFHLRTESLFHNLDHEILAAPAFIPVVDSDPAAVFGVKSEQDLFRYRYKIATYPLHLNLGYWRMAKEGDAQLRFADFNFTSGGTLFSRSRRIDRETHEGNVGFDAHVGPVDVVYAFQIRQFEDRAGAPRDVLSSNPLTQQHNEAPDSRFYSHTIKLHTSLTGGIVGAASYSFGRRENLSSLTDIRGADQTADTLHNVAGDFVYTPCREFSLAVKYRRQEIERDNQAALTSALTAGSVIPLRPPIDSQKDIVVATASIRPSSVLTVNGEYKGAFLHRDNASLTDTSAALWRVPGESDAHSGTVSVSSRPLKGLRLRAQYGYTATSNPSFNSSSESKHEGQVSASYNGSKSWGVTANYRLTREWNDQISQTATTPAPNSVSETFVLPLDRKMTHAAASLWFSPLERLTISGSCGFLRTSADQAILFASSLPGSQAGTNLTSQAQIYSLNAVYGASEALDLSLALQQVRSRSEFDPEFKAVGSSDTTGIKDVSRLKTVENSLSARVDYHLTKRVACGVDYTYRDFDNKVSPLFEGTVHVVTAQIRTIW